MNDIQNLVNALFIFIGAYIIAYMVGVGIGRGLRRTRVGSQIVDLTIAHYGIVVTYGYSTSIAKGIRGKTLAAFYHSIHFVWGKK